jgi:hypothetical protein
MEEREEFLPPEPSGPEPDLGDTPGPAPQPPPPPPPAPPGQWGPANAGFPSGAPQPQQQSPPGWQPPPPGYPPPAQPWQQPPPPQPYAWAPRAPAQPDNGPAVTGFTLSMIAAGLWLITAGLSSIVSIVCAALGIVFSRRGKRKIEAGETEKHKSLAQAGYISGIVMVVLASLTTLAWIAFFVLYAVNADFRHDIDNEFNTTSNSAAPALVAAALRLGRLALG